MATKKKLVPGFANKPEPVTKPGEAKVEILRCPQHGFMAVAIDDHRITDSKCCGSWSIVRTWMVSKDELRRHVEDPKKITERERKLARALILDGRQLSDAELDDNIRHELGLE